MDSVNRDNETPEVVVVVVCIPESEVTLMEDREVRALLLYDTFLLTLTLRKQA
jgi:hypothetical protein